MSRNSRINNNHTLYQTDLQNSTNRLLNDIKTNTSNINVNVDSLEVNTDGLETLQTSANNTLSSIDNKIILPSVLNSDQLKVNDSAVVAGLSQINNNVDGLEATATTIATNTTGLNNCVNGNELQVDIVSGSITLPTGAATSALQTTINSTLGDTNSKIDAMRGSNSITDLATKLNAGLPSALSSDQLKVIDNDSHSKIDDLRSLTTTGNNTLSSIDNKVVLPTSLDSGKLKVVDSAVVDVGNKIDAMRASDTLTTLKGVLDTIDADTGAIKTAVELIDNTVDGTELRVDVINQPNMKLEDLSSSLNAQHVSGTSRSLAVGIKGTTDITDVPSNSKFLLCDAAGHLQIDIVDSAPDNLTTTLVVDSQSVASGGGTHTTGSFQITKNPKGDGKLRFLTRISGVAASDITINYQVSGDDTNFFGVPFSFTTIENATTGVGQFNTLSYIAKHLKIQVVNNNGSSTATVSVHMFS